MVKVDYQWSAGATLSEHSRRKHKILREYFARYLLVRCSLPRERFRVAIVDGFAGGGRYGCGASGSPLIFIEELKRGIDEINLLRAAQGARSIEIECLLILNDAEEQAVTLLREVCEPRLAEIQANCPQLHIAVQYLNSEFETVYPSIKATVEAGKYRNVIYNLDQCGYGQVQRSTLRDMMASTPSAEIFYTFMIEALLAYLRKANPAFLQTQLNPFGIDASRLRDSDGHLSKQDWLGAAERLVFASFHEIAAFSSPFSINNPDGWRYWFIHFAHNYRARQVYNDVLHQNSTFQAHFGRSGLNMLAYDPSKEGGLLYLFDVDGRTAAKDQLHEDIPRLVAEAGDVMSVQEFYDAVYNATAAHSDDIHTAMLGSGELQIITPGGGERRVPNTISVSDTLKLRSQRSLFPMFLNLPAGAWVPRPVSLPEPIATYDREIRAEAKDPENSK